MLEYGICRSQRTAGLQLPVEDNHSQIDKYLDGRIGETLFHCESGMDMWDPFL